jgi:multicomponent Na+:H+ antiporter subunit C
MEWFTIENIAMATGFILMLIGIWGILTSKNILRIIIGFSLFDTGLHIIMVAIAYIKGRTAPILDNAVNKTNAIHEIVDPVPQALVLTAIVIGLGITALMLVFALKMYNEKGTLDIKHFKSLKW